MLISSSGDTGPIYFEIQCMSDAVHIGVLKTKLNALGIPFQFEYEPGLGYTKDQSQSGDIKGLKIKNKDLVKLLIETKI